MTSLIAGETATIAATKAGVHRSTVHRWQSDPEFVAEINTRRMDLRRATDERLARLLNSAVDAVERALETGDARIALAILRGFGMLDGNKYRIGPTEAEEVTLNQDFVNRQRDLRHKLLG